MGVVTTCNLHTHAHIKYYSGITRLLTGGGGGGGNRPDILSDQD